MADFMIRFFLCNLFVCGIIGILLIARRIFQSVLSARMQYHLWFLLLGLLAVPFLPFRPAAFLQLPLWLKNLRNVSNSKTNTILTKTAHIDSSKSLNWMDDFAQSVNGGTSSAAGWVLFGIWTAGILAMTVLLLKSALRLHALKKSALPLQNPTVRNLYNRCLKEMGIQKTIPVYSAAFLKSPVITGLFKPSIYLPIHLISDYRESGMRYMLLHELSHYRHRDLFAGVLMNLAGVLYWFNPVVWYALKEMRNDREVACDTSVLEMLEENTYKDYGNTLIDFAEKISLTPFPFASGLGGNMQQMKRRICNIASYQKPTPGKKRKGYAAFALTAVFLFGLTPILSTYASEESRYSWKSPEKISNLDLSAYFGTYTGSFVLYDLEQDSWQIYDRKNALLRVSPDSTYKIYDALSALETGVITPEDSFLPWDKTVYPFDAWNADQTLDSAMRSSVNWYFQTLDQQLGKTSIQSFIQEIRYGNCEISGDLSSYWLESSLKISPVEQVELLTKLYRNSFAFAPENIHAVKNAIRLSDSESGTLYGKTGTGNVKGQNVNGWFVGYAESPGHTCFFAINIRAENDASGSRASEIALSVLNDMGIWQQ